MTLKDLFLLDAALHGHKVDTTHWIVAKISSSKDVVERVIEFGTIVTMIVEGGSLFRLSRNLTNLFNRILNLSLFKMRRLIFII